MTEDQKRELEALRKRLGMKVDPKVTERNWNRALEIIQQARDKGAEHGLSARCPVCNAGKGTWCRIDMSNRSSAVVKHAERVALATQS